MGGHRTSVVARRAAAAVVMMLASTAAIPVTNGAAGAATRAVTIDYSMAPRFGADRNGDGLRNDPHNSLTSANPSTFTVTVNGCANVSSSYRWTIGNLPTFTTTTCRTTVQLTQGLKLVRLRLADGSEGSTIIWVRDILIVVMGDSVASGEGNPDAVMTATSPVRWQSRRCHRSSRSGFALAARQIEDMDRRSSVTFVHVACSGAGVRFGILEPYPGIEPGALDIESQIEQVRFIVGARPISALVMNTGANDAGFGLVVQNCIVQDDCQINTASARITGSEFIIEVMGIVCGGLTISRPFCFALRDELAEATTGPSAAREFALRLPDLPGRYAALASTISRPRSDGGLGTPASRVFLTEYFDPSRDQLARTCDPDNFGAEPLRLIPGVSRSEYSWVRTTVVPQLNAEGATAAAAAGWTRIGGIASAFSRGGYCANDANRLIRRLDESFIRQSNHKGTLHPNGAGHLVYRDRVSAALSDFLF